MICIIRKKKKRDLPPLSDFGSSEHVETVGDKLARFGRFEIKA